MQSNGLPPPLDINHRKTTTTQIYAEQELERVSPQSSLHMELLGSKFQPT